MNKITLFDTGTASENLGDLVIMDYCEKQLRGVFPKAMFYRIPTHLDLWRDGWSIANTSQIRFVCGTNLLKNHMLSRVNRQWRIGPVAGYKLKPVCLMGIGWNNYEDSQVDIYTKKLYKKLFSGEYIHSVRDKYTISMLNSLGINNVIYTACPTMWNLTPEHCSEVPKGKSKNVLTTLTDYRKNPDKDRQLLDIIFRNYDNVYMWIQSLGDLDYVKSLRDCSNIKFIMPSLEELDSLLDSSESIDYIGTRLHCGIRALNHKRRSIIIGVDNRAAEISKDTGLLVLDRSNIGEELEKLIHSEVNTKIALPYKNIEIWRKQFISG